ncbi:hypothetical protein [Kordiimonas pumila]|uniref:Uncharacterized protein n=1 Tax=Kordiimonas pumila TaxID=2161677 RepID=A0ABV7D651_9PROT|nr:hypothetical protein [Kordiimonas pumila]
MNEQATIIDFVSASLHSLEASGRTLLSPTEQEVADDLAVTLDQTLGTMVKELERIASCQQDTPVVEGLDELPPFEAFCVGLKHIGAALLPHMIEVFEQFCSDNAAPKKPFGWILRARADAFVAYLLQLAQVHGLAFDDSLERLGKKEQIALARLGADLRILMQSALEKTL